MVRDFWRRPAVVVGAWTVLFVVVFVMRGDLRVNTDTQAGAKANERAHGPVVVRPDKPPTQRNETVVQKGRVFDAMGFLLVGAEVVPMNGPAARTDADGVFRVELEADSWTDVLVRAVGQRSTWLRVAAGSPDALVVRLVPEAPWDNQAALLPPVPALRGEGNARTPDGQPLANCFVMAMGTGIWVRSDAVGRFVVPVPSPAATLLLHQPEGPAGGFAMVAPPMSIGRDQGLVPLPELVASPASSLRGIVRDAGGSPLAGVPVSVRGAQLDRVVETGSGGAFRLGGLLPGSYRVQPFAFRGAIGAAVDITLDRANNDCDLQLRLAEERRLRVVDESGAPVASVYVVSSVDGLRRGLAQADAGGWASVPVALGTSFEVRAPTTYAPVAVRRFEFDAATLIVAGP